MREEADITINRVRLDDAQSEVLRIAVDAFAVMLAEGLAAEDEAIDTALTERYLAALTGVQKLLNGRELRTQ
jgi:hypothetical protein